MTLKYQYLLLLVFFSLFTCAQDKNPVNTNHDYEVVVPDLSIPWGFVFLPDIYAYQ